MLLVREVMYCKPGKVRALDQGRREIFKIEG